MKKTLSYVAIAATICFLACIPAVLAYGAMLHPGDIDMKRYWTSTLASYSLTALIAVIIVGAVLLIESLSKNLNT